MTHSQSAFTIMEVLVALSILAILLAISLPAMQHFIAHAQDEMLQAQLLHAIQIAKQEAIARHTRIALCQSNNQITCSGNWGDGYIIFLDENADGRVHDNEQILYVSQLQSQHGRNYIRSFPRYRNYLSFSSSGLMTSDNATLWHCHADSPKWALVMSKTGRTRIMYPNRNGEMKDNHGQLLNC